MLLLPLLTFLAHKQHLPIHNLTNTRPTLLPLLHLNMRSNPRPVRNRPRTLPKAPTRLLYRKRQPLTTSTRLLQAATHSSSHIPHPVIQSLPRLSRAYINDPRTSSTSPTTRISLFQKKSVLSISATRTATSSSSPSLQSTSCNRRSQERPSATASATEPRS